eukprot:CAMPEP_0201595102 /NCGR_PEP_ID=MMETSP0190_2-20130828/192217_1 /ASSEMBLY_ACC=CAM_ASM_000263 /TAXON_ID=37353 /ORGANISM="Rosalina sp." /LENGTH=74 /DNA_ID=CAMNT_0048054975 /DNA_START=30 /DNA_END=251 /DNA_ORIENTATION=+
MKMKMEKNPFNISSINSGSRALKRSTMENDFEMKDQMAPPRKRTRIDNNHNSNTNIPPSMDNNNNEIMPDHQIW